MNLIRHATRCSSPPGSLLFLSLALLVTVRTSRHRSARRGVLEIIADQPPAEQRLEHDERHLARDTSTWSEYGRAIVAAAPRPRARGQASAPARREARTHACGALLDLRGMPDSRSQRASPASTRTHRDDEQGRARRRTEGHGRRVAGESSDAWSPPARTRRGCAPRGSVERRRRARAAQPRAQHIVEGSLNGGCQLKYVKRTARTSRVGDLVATSGLDGIFRRAWWSGRSTDCRVRRRSSRPRTSSPRWTSTSSKEVMVVRRLE